MPNKSIDSRSLSRTRNGLKKQRSQKKSSDLSKSDKRKKKLRRKRQKKNSGDGKKLIKPKRLKRLSKRRPDCRPRKKKWERSISPSMYQANK